MPLPSSSPGRYAFLSHFLLYAQLSIFECILKNVYLRFFSFVSAQTSRAPHSSTSSSLNQWVNASGAKTTSWTVDALRPYMPHKFFVLPYYKSAEGMPWNILDGTTHEAGINIMAYRFIHFYRFIILSISRFLFTFLRFSSIN